MNVLHFVGLIGFFLSSQMLVVSNAEAAKSRLFPITAEIGGLRMAIPPARNICLGWGSISPRELFVSFSDAFPVAHNRAYCEGDLKYSISIIPRDERSSYPKVLDNLDSPYSVGAHLQQPRQIPTSIAHYLDNLGGVARELYVDSANRSIAIWYCDRNKYCRVFSSFGPVSVVLITGYAIEPDDVEGVYRAEKSLSATLKDWIVR